MPASRNRASRWFPVLTFLLTGLAAGNQVARWPARLLYPGDANHGGDSISLVEMLHMRKGVPIDSAVQAYLKQRFPPRTPALGRYSGDLVRAGLETPITNIYHYTWLVRAGVLSDRDLVFQLQNRRFGVIVLTFDLQNDQDSYWENVDLTKAMRRAIQENYQLDEILEMPDPEKFRAEDRLYVWVPRPNSVANPRGSQ